MIWNTDKTIVYAVVIEMIVKEINLFNLTRMYKVPSHSLPQYTSYDS